MWKYIIERLMTTASVLLSVVLNSFKILTVLNNLNSNGLKKFKFKRFLYIQKLKL